MANEIYLVRGTARTWSDALTTSDELADLGGLASQGVVCGSFHDLGVDPRPEEYEWILYIDGFDTAPVVGQTVDLYFTQSEATTGFDGGGTDPTTTAEGTMVKGDIRNHVYAGSVSIRSTTAADTNQARGTVRLTSRYVAPVVHNNSDDPLLSTSDAHLITLTPIYPQGQ